MPTVLSFQAFRSGVHVPEQSLDPLSLNVFSVLAVPEFSITSMENSSKNKEQKIKGHLVTVGVPTQKTLKSQL